MQRNLDPTQLDPGTTRRLVAQAGVLFLAILIYLVSVWWTVPDDPNTLRLTTFTYLLLVPVALWVAFTGGWRRVLDRSMFSALLLGGALICHLVGECLYGYYQIRDIEQMPAAPASYDILFTLGLLLTLAGILTLPTRPLSWALRGRVAIDGIVTAAGVLTLLWYFQIAPAIEETYEGQAAQFFAISYPVIGALLLTSSLLLGRHVRAQRLRLVCRLLAASIALCMVSDVIWSNLHLTGEPYIEGSWSALWLISYALLAMALPLLRSVPTAAVVHDASVIDARVSVFRMALPYLLIILTVGLAVYELQSPSYQIRTVGVLIGSSVMVVLVLLRQLMQIIENAHLYGQLRQAYASMESLAITDGMTGLLNHRAFQERLSEACAQARRYHRPISLLMIDVDSFKSYNDTFGHPAGDQLLKRLADLLRANCRSCDIPARYGGEELAIILPETDAHQARTLAERIRAAVAEHPFPHRPVTISIGIATADDRIDTPDRLVCAADDALYQAKRSGKNRSVHHRDLSSRASSSQTLVA